MDIQEKKIAFMFRLLRERANLSVEEVAEKLKEYDIKISPKTIYNWETAHSTPKITTFLALGVIYKCKDLLSIFGFDNNELDPSLEESVLTDDISVSLNQKETRIITHYRQLNDEGQERLLETSSEMLQLDKYIKTIPLNILQTDKDQPKENKKIPLFKSDARIEQEDDKYIPLLLVGRDGTRLNEMVNEKEILKILKDIDNMGEEGTDL